jgi:hypothetical protein
LRFLSTGTIHWRIALTVVLRGLASMLTGSRSSLPASARIGSEKVAENSRVWRLWQQRQQLVDVARKAEVEHAVGLVQHQGLHLVEAHRVLALQVEQAAGRGHQQVDALAQASSSAD